MTKSSPRRIRAGKQVPRLAVQPRHVVADRAQLVQHLGHRCVGRIRARRIGVEAFAGKAVEDCLGHDRPGRIAGAQKQHIERWRHRAGLSSGRGGRSSERSPQSSGRAAATRLGQKDQQLAQRDDAHRVDDLSALSRRRDQPGRSSALRWKDVVEAGIPSRSASSPAGNPFGPCASSRRKTPSRLSCAMAPKIRAASFASMILE